MFNFFAKENSRVGDRFFINGADLNHIKNVLRLKVGDEILISCEGQSHLCQISLFSDDSLEAQIIEENANSTELETKICLFEGLPKGDKLETIIQKTVELGVYKIIPVEMARSIVKLDDKKKKQKRERWQAICESAAKQSKRNIIPEISLPLKFNDALKEAEKLDLLLVPYENENGMQETLSALKGLAEHKSVGIFIGPEGGFEESEIQSLKKLGGKIISLGKRILRTETAAITATAMCMLALELNQNGETK